MCIICPTHGEFWQIPNSHLNGHGCKQCSLKKNISKKTFSKEYAYNILYTQSIKNNYTFSNFEYKNQHTLVNCKCNICNREWQTEFQHLKNGTSCFICSSKKRNSKYKLSENYVKQKCIEISEKNNYLVGSFNYEANYKPNIPCKCCICGHHWKQSFANIMKGNSCPICANRNLKQFNKLYNELIKYFPNQIKREYNLKIKLDKRALRLDIYIPSKKIGIEYQGRQHFKPIKWFGGEKSFLKQRENDIMKRDYCKKNNIKLLYFTYNKTDAKNEYIDKVYTDFNLLLKEIFNSF